MLQNTQSSLNFLAIADSSFPVHTDYKRLEYEKPVTVEAESQNLKEEFKVGYYEEAISHVYRKDKYVGVTFDKNGGDSEAWVNHEIIEKGKSIKDCNTSSITASRFATITRWLRSFPPKPT